MAKQRIFVAIDVSSELKNILEAYLEPFFKERFVRIPKKEGWHVTVSFCGYLDETEVRHLEEILKRAVSLFKPFYLKPDKVSFALDRRPHSKPRMVWLYFEKSPEFSKLKSFIEKEMGLKQKESIPHLTLARFKEQYYSNLKNYLPEGGVDLKDEAESFLVNSVKIYESHLSSEGAEYKLIFKAEYA
jgi:2'-5' RNA ligase